MYSSDRMSQQEAGLYLLQKISEQTLYYTTAYLMLELSLTLFDRPDYLALSYHRCLILIQTSFIHMICTKTLHLNETENAEL